MRRPRIARMRAALAAARSSPANSNRFASTRAALGVSRRIARPVIDFPEPELLIADEPTSALDVTVRMQVLAILDDLVSRRGLALVFISHDLNLVATFCDRVLVMYAGRIVEECRASELARASHPYTRGLLGSLPRLDAPRERLAVLQRDPVWLES